MKSINISKRIFMMILVAWITFISVFQAYQTTVECAEWVAGTIATIGAGPMLTALLVGGVVVAGGVAIYKIATTDAEDYRAFAQGIKQGFQEFVSEQEKQIALENDASLSDQEAADLGVAAARETVNDFWNKAVTTSKNTVTNIKLKAWKYWDLYSRIIGNVADNGVNSNTEITPTTVIIPPVINGTVSGQKSNIGANCYNYQGDWYISNGTYWLGSTITLNKNLSTSNIIEIPFIWMNGNDNIATCWAVSIVNGVVQSSLTRMSNNYINVSQSSNYSNLIANTNLPILKGNDSTNSWQSNVIQNWRTMFKVGAGGDVKNYENTVSNTLNNTKFGDAIQTGRKQLVNNGDWIGSIFKEDSVPINKGNIKSVDNVLTGEIGWQIPYPDAWDDYFGGVLPFPDVVGGTGALGVPYPDILNPDGSDTSVDFPDDIPVQDTSDYPRESTENPSIDDNKPQEIPEQPAQDVFDSQGGTFYPTALDLTNIFPFCIPFDIIYLVEKFDASGERAPVITIPIVYPQAIRGAMGSDGYDIVIDFQDFLVVRNILRTFLLILFIVGLLKITRDLIRG